MLQGASEKCKGRAVIKNWSDCAGCLNLRFWAKIASNIQKEPGTVIFYRALLSSQILCSIADYIF